MAGDKKNQFCRASKYVVWPGIEICHLVGSQNMSFGRASKYVIWDEICYLLRPKNGQNISFGWGQNLSFGRVLKIVNWLRVEICHLVYVTWSSIEISKILLHT